MKLPHSERFMSPCILIQYSTWDSSRPTTSRSGLEYKDVDTLWEVGHSTQNRGRSVYRVQWHLSRQTTYHSGLEYTGVACQKVHQSSLKSNMFKLTSIMVYVYDLFSFINLHLSWNVCVGQSSEHTDLHERFLLRSPSCTWRVWVHKWTAVVAGWRHLRKQTWHTLANKHQQQVGTLSQ